MTGYPELEIGLYRRQESSVYTVELRFNQPGSDADIQPVPPGQPQARLDLEQLRRLESDPLAYGQALTEGLFSDPAVLSAFEKAYASSQTQNLALRMRLLIGASAPELHGLRWETLRTPQDGSPLCTGAGLFFSRYLSSQDWRPVRLRPKAELSALVVVANPQGLAQYNLAEIDVEAELERARQALTGIRVNCLPDVQSDKRASLETIIASLRQERPDILYLVCHGALVQGTPWLWLEDAQGQVARLPGGELALRLRELEHCPRLVVLASCESAAPGDGSGPALAALGPQLAEAGIPAVLAMLDKVSLATLGSFMTVFFQELMRDGQIDRATAVARGAVRDRPDYWMPALFMRLKSGRIWYVPGFGEARPGFDQWPSLLYFLKRGECTPILGPGLDETLLGSSRDIARNWAESYRYPMAPYERESLPQVAQYLTVSQYERAPYNELQEILRAELYRRFPEALTDELRQASISLDQQIEAVGDWRRSNDPFDPYNALARMPLPIYITTSPANFMAAALKEAGKDPQSVICPWNPEFEQLDSIYLSEPDYRPTVERPLVYHLFGLLSEPDSLVLTEDDYFAFLIGVTRYQAQIPEAVRAALARTALLFLGFQIDGWEFRVIFQSLISREGDKLRRRYVHIAAQIEAEEGRLLEPERARRYLEGYFQDANISIYWGSVDDFMRELLPRWSGGGA